jgi:glutamyl-tRNA reductase
MPILTLGVSYRRAPVELLERLAFADEDAPKAYKRLGELEAVRGGVVVSTCNRVEVTADVESYHAGFQALRAFLSESREVPFEEFSALLYSPYEEQAVQHLFSVASGLDSMVLGEPQILAQVRAAHRAAEQERPPGSLLTALFRRAVRVGRRARAETAIGASPAAFVEAGAELAARALGPLNGRPLLVVGAGAMGDIAVRTLVARGMGPVTVVNRTQSRGEALARRTGAKAMGLTHLPEALAEADLVASFTGASEVVVDRRSVERAIEARNGRPLFLLDLAVPRDVDPAVIQLPNVHLVDIDALKDVVIGADEAEIGRVRAIIAHEVARFAEWRRASRLAPVIRALYDRAEWIRSAELRRAGGKLEHLSEEERAAVEAATRAIVAKLLHHPVVRAKQIGEGDDVDIRLLARLFDLEPPPSE